MVNPREIVDLDPATEDILSIWGKDLTAQNLEWYFRSLSSQGNGSFSSGGLRNNMPSKVSLEGNLDLSGFRSQGIKGFQEVCIPEENDLQVRISHPIQESKGKPFSMGSFLSGGLEDIVNYGLTLGFRNDGGIERAPAVTRAILTKGLVSPSRNEGWKEVGSGGHLEPRKSHSGHGIEKQVVDFELTGLVNDPGSKITSDSTILRIPILDKNEQEEQ